ncbi:S41 family peptidase [Prevotella sp. OH937_COT-195]|uniref:S41 family peptidase n=1 Tax=Prevotella sp. OH937_COT-195 TaxID=2491051 RepID=UPI002939530B|nr:S41 family peptidase [Prevotella sp. OH937_COT-195]
MNIYRPLRCLRVTAFALSLLLSAAGMAQEGKDHNFQVAKNIDIFNAIYRNLDMMYVDSLNADEVIGTGVNAMLRSLDPYTVYYPASEVKDLKMMITGKYAGIGALVRYNARLKRVVIDEPYANTPAAEAGLKKGDVILSIDDSVTTNKDVAYVSSHLRGDPGTTFALKILRPSSGKTLTKKMTRRPIQMPAIPYYGIVEGNTGYINLNSFTEGCSKEMRRAFVDLRERGIGSLLIDLRGNGGGSLDEAVKIVNMFVPKNIMLVTTKGKLTRANREYRTTTEPIDTDIPIVVLVNGETASASEITAGSLQDLDRAVVLGTRTYGKGLVQTPLELPYNANLKITTGKYFIPSGRCIQAINYKHSRGGYTEHIADSLTKVFHTSGGREVRDGGGIKPDVEVLPDSLPNIAFYLGATGRDTTEVMFDYELDYIAAHPTIAPAREFDLSDDDYEEFKRRVIASGFSYDPETGKVLKSLKKLAQFEGYYNGAKAEFEALEAKLKHDIGHDLDRNKEVLKSMMRADIVAAYYFQSGAIENSIGSDKQIKEAVALLRDAERYDKILGKRGKQTAQAAFTATNQR